MDSPARSRIVDELRPRDRELLDFERNWPAHEGSKRQAIRAELGLSPTRYYELLARLVDDPAALAHDPLLVRRLRRRRAERVRDGLGPVAAREQHE